METFTVHQLAALAGVSVRTLHHYDTIGLLKPASRTESRYRHYGRAELLRLQQILLYKELDFPLAQIRMLLDDPGFDLMKALQQQKQELQKRKARMSALLSTIDHTIHQLKNNKKMDYNELYKGFSKEQAEALEKEASERWGAETIRDSQQRLLKMSKAEWAALQERTEALNRSLASSMQLPPEAPAVQALIAEHYAIIGVHFDVTPAIYRSMGGMYAEDERFRAYYEQYRPGLAGFLHDAILVFTKDA